jgi:hypothetical protein
MKLLAFFLLQGLNPKLDNELVFSRGKSWKTPIFLDLFSEEVSPSILLTTKVMMMPHKPILDHQKQTNSVSELY